VEKIIKSLWNLFLAIIAKPAKKDSKLQILENAPVKYFYPIPENIEKYSKEEIRNYANELTEFILKKSVN